MTTNQLAKELHLSYTMTCNALWQRELQPICVQQDFSWKIMWDKEEVFEALNKPVLWDTLSGFAKALHCSQEHLRSVINKLETRPCSREIQGRTYYRIEEEQMKKIKEKVRQ